MTSALDFIILALTFSVVAMLSVAAVRSVEHWLKISRRLAGHADEPAETAPEIVKRSVVQNDWLKWVKSFTLDQSGEESRLRRDLAYAGFDSPSAPVLFVLFRLAAATGLPTAYLLMQALSGKAEGGSNGVLFALILCLVGFVLPQMLLRHRSNERRADLVMQFPDSLDLLVICVESGVGLEAAFVRVGTIIADSHPRISKEFILMTQEIGAGRSRADALRAMAHRTDVDLIKSFVAVIVQSDALGVSIGRTLRTFSTEMRETRYLNAEEKALRIPVLMTIPLVACMLPVIVTALLLPAIIDVIRTLAPALEGGA
ncbi:MAG: type II secretion system F family protein [Caulobacterales bacterium]